jgi:hypothetical protein
LYSIDIEDVTRTMSARVELKKFCDHESQGAFRQDELIGGKSPVVSLDSESAEISNKATAQIGTDVRVCVFNAGLLARSQSAYGRSCDRLT